MRDSILIAVYGILQKSLKVSGIVNEYGRPVKTKHLIQEDEDTLEIYKWLSVRLKGYSEISLNDRKEEFNNNVKKLEREYYLNNFLIAIFMLEFELDDSGTTAQKIVIKPKVNRLVKVMREGILEEAENNNDNGLAIVRDSKIAASNIIRLFNGLPEITKKMRAYKADQWRRAKDGIEH